MPYTNSHGCHRLYVSNDKIERAEDTIFSTSAPVSMGCITQEETIAQQPVPHSGRAFILRPATREPHFPA